MTTVFRTKGLEYDHVFIPECVEGMMPCTQVTDIPVFDLQAKGPELEPSSSIENERRLFYVAITRARVGVHIGTRELPRLGFQKASSGPAPSRFLHEIRLGRTKRIVQALHAPGGGAMLDADPSTLMETLLEEPIMG